MQINFPCPKAGLLLNLLDVVGHHLLVAFADLQRHVLRHWRVLHVCFCVCAIVQTCDR